MSVSAAASFWIKVAGFVFFAYGFQRWCKATSKELTVRNVTKEDRLNQSPPARPFKAIGAKIATRWLVVILCLVVWLAVIFLFVF